jgi:hypothetical protein
MQRATPAWFLTTASLGACVQAGPAAVEASTSSGDVSTGASATGSGETTTAGSTGAPCDGALPGGGLRAPSPGSGVSVDLVGG